VQHFDWWPGERETGWAQQTRSPVLARNGMVASSQPLASQAGLRILQEGGNAADAAVAAAAVLNVVEPMMTGIGGDVFAIVYLAQSGELLGLNASGRAASGATPEFYAARGIHSMPGGGIHAATVPGCVDGWDQLLRRAGTMGFAEVLRPAIEYAEQGFPVSELIAGQWASSADALHGDADSTRTWLVDGRPPESGSLFSNPALGRSLRLLAQEGRDAFYQGEIARAIVAKSESLGGLFTAQDLAAHTSTWVEPIHTSYRGHEVYELPPNTQGVAALQMLNVLEGYDLAALGPQSTAYWHRLIEAKKLAYADLDAHLADPAFAAVPTARMVAKNFAAQQRARIDERRAAGRIASGIAAGPPPRGPGGGDTVYLTAADRWGNMVSFINSLYGLFGSGVTVGDTGILLHNRGALFSLDPAHPNCVEPGKRPYHTLVPAFATRDGRPWLSFGVMGGDMQPQGHVQVLVNLIDFGMNVQAAGDVARCHHFQSPNVVAVEAGFDPQVLQELASLGHRLARAPGTYGGYQAIQVDPQSGAYAGASDPRKDGLAVGY
jgi:gamma-glutamyltranspeptidase / glutathione hydrolase